MQRPTEANSLGFFTDDGLGWEHNWNLDQFALCTALWEDYTRNSQLVRRTNVNERLKSKIPTHSLSLLSTSLRKLNMDGRQRLAFGAVWNEIFTKAQGIISLRCNSQLAATTQGTAILHIAIHQLVNGQSVSEDTRPSLWDMAARGYDPWYTVEPIYGSHSAGRQTAPRLERTTQPVKWLLAYLQNKPEPVFRQLQKCLPAPYSDALIRGLFDNALHNRAYQVLYNLIWTSAAPDTLVQWQENSRRTEDLLHAILYCPTADLSKLIIQHWDDRSKRSAASLLGWGSGSLRRDLIPSRTCSEALKELVFHIPCSNEILNLMMVLSNMTLVKEVIRQMPSPRSLRFLTWINNYFCTSAIRLLCEEDALWSISTVIQEAMVEIPDWPVLSEHFLRSNRLVNDHRREYCPSFTRLSVSGSLSDALGVAVARNFMSVVEVLLAAGARSTENCLCQAVHLRHLGLVVRFMNSGASPFKPDRPDRITLQSHNDRTAASGYIRHNPGLSYTTAYAESIKTRFSDATYLFDDEFCRDNHVLDEAACWTIIVAASMVRDKGLLTKMIQVEQTKCIPDDDSPLPSGLRLANRALVFSEALFYAYKTNDKEIVNILLENGALPSYQLAKESVHACDLDMTILFFESRAFSSREIGYINRSNSFERADRNKAELVMMIMELCDQNFLYSVLDHINLYEMSGSGKVLERTIQRRDIHLARHLLDMGLNIDVASQEPLKAAIECQDKDMIQLLLERTVAVGDSWHSKTALLAALSVRDDRLVDQLLELGADPYDPDVISTLAKDANVIRVQEILISGRNRWMGRRSHHLHPALLKAMDSNDRELFRILIDHTEPTQLQRCFLGNIEANLLGQVMLHRKQLLHPEFMRLVLHAGANVEAVCYAARESPKADGSAPGLYYTPLLCAVAINSIAHVDTLLEHGANINRKTTKVLTYTPVQLAAKLGYTDLVSHLISKNADINASPAISSGGTALQFASLGGFIQMAETLLRRGADVNALPARFHGRNAFEAAAENGRLDMMLLLVREGADLVTDGGERSVKRAIGFAEKRGNHAAVALAKKLQTEARAAENEFKLDCSPVLPLDFNGSA